MFIRVASEMGGWFSQPLQPSPARPQDVGQELGEEPLNQPPPAGQAEVDEEGTGGEGGGGGENDHPVCEDGLRDCRFSEADTERKVGPCVALDKSYQENSKNHSADIDKEYSRVFALRSEINALLAGFKQRLELQEHMNLRLCFKNLKELVGLYDTLEFDEEAMKIVIDPNADEDAVEAVNKFNMMLEKSHEFQEKLQTSKPVMEEKLMALEKESTQTQETLDAIARAKNQLECVQEWEADVKHIIFDTKTSSKLFTSGRIVTGLQT